MRPEFSPIGDGVGKRSDSSNEQADIEQALSLFCVRDPLFVISIVGVLKRTVGQRIGRELCVVSFSVAWFIIDDVVGEVRTVVRNFSLSEAFDNVENGQRPCTVPLPFGV